MAKVTATVEEQNQGTILVYRLIGSNPAFTMIDSASGDIFTQTIIDREMESYFIYTVEAVDNRSPPKTGYVTVSEAKTLSMRLPSLNLSSRIIILFVPVIKKCPHASCIYLCMLYIFLQCLILSPSNRLDNKSMYHTNKRESHISQYVGSDWLVSGREQIAPCPAQQPIRSEPTIG